MTTKNNYHKMNKGELIKKLVELEDRIADAKREYSVTVFFNIKAFDDDDARSVVENFFKKDLEYDPSFICYNIDVNSSEW